MKSVTLRRAISFVVLSFIAIIAGVLAFSAFAPGGAAFAADYKLTVEGTPTARVVTGGTADLEIKLKNNSSETVDYISLWDATTYGEGEDEFCPYTFQDKRKSPQPTGAIVTPAGDNCIYGIGAGKTATFHVLVQAGSMEPGTHNDFLQFANWGYEYDYTEWGWPIYETRRKVLYEMYSDKIPIEVIPYNPADAALSVGRGENNGATVTPFPASGIDLGTIDVSSSYEDVLNLKIPFYIKNVSPTVDTYTGARPDITLIEGSGLDYDRGNGAVAIDSPIRYDNGYGLWSYDTTLGPDAPHAVAVKADATQFIAGTYEAEVRIGTIPRKVKVNGREGDNSGAYSIPVTLTLTGTNPRLPEKARNLSVNPGNGLNELTWQPSAADEDAEVSYYIFRREGTETKTNPDSWTVQDWSRYERLNYNTVSAKDDGTYLYIDGTVENGKTYSYVVGSDDPFKCYASAPASGTPDASLETRLLAPDRAYAADQVGGVELVWEMNEFYGGSECDGSGMVDHFNIYRDGVLINQIYQSAVDDEVSMGVITDGDGNSHYGITGHSYSWTYMDHTPEIGQAYTYEVSCVDKKGREGYMSEPDYAKGLPEETQIVGQRVYFNTRHDTELPDGSSQEGPALEIMIKTLAQGDNVDKLKFWRADGTAAPDTNAAPYATVDKNYVYGQYDFADTGVRAGRVYTYTVQATDNTGYKTGFYTFTAAASEDAVFSTTDVEWRILGGRKASMTWYSDYVYDEEGDFHYTGTYKVYRDGVLKKTFSGADDGEYTFTDDPGDDGTYVYRMDKQYKVGGTTYTIPGQEFTFVRDTAPVDESRFTVPPSAPKLTARVTNGYPVLTWEAGDDGGEPKGYHIYRMDAGEYVQGSHYESVYHWNGYSDEVFLWGNARYLTIQDGKTKTFTDGAGSYYLNDKYLGIIEQLSWYEDKCPHTYWITAYNDAGESARSEQISFEYAGENEYGSPNYPTSPAEDIPKAPEISGLRLDWEDFSTRSRFSGSVYGYVRVSWEDAPESVVDKWKIYTTGTHNSENTTPDYNELTYADAAQDPSLKKGGSDFFLAGVSAVSGGSGDLGRTVTVRVEAENGEGTASSEEKFIFITSLPRFRAVADNGGACLEWTDLLNDSGTQVTGWEIWRRPEYGTWKRVKSLDASIDYAGTEKDYNNQDTSYYQWNDENLDNGWTYEYKVVAKCADGIDRPSVVKKVTPTGTSTAVPPGPPQNLSAQVSNGEILFNWDKPLTGTAGYYQVMYQIEGEDDGWTWVGSVYAPSTSVAYAPRKAGTYRCFVYAYNYIDGDMVPRGANVWETDDINLLYPSHSEIIEVTVTEADIAKQQSGYPAKPVLSAESGDGQITLNWTLEDEGGMPTFFEIERYKSGGRDTAFPKVTMTAGSASSWTYTDKTAEPGVMYVYQVTARMASSGSGIYTDIYAMAEGTTRDEIAAERMEELIDALPDPDYVQASDAEQIEQAAQIWDGLTAKQKKLVDSAAAQKLADCRMMIETLALREQYAEIIDPVQAMIAALPDADEVSLDDAGAIEQARAAFNAVPAEAKQLIRTARLTAAEEALRDLKYNVAHAVITVSGRMMIGGGEMPEITVSMNGAQLTAGTDYTVKGYRRTGDTAVSGSVDQFGTYTVRVRGSGQYFGETESEDTFTAYEAADDLSLADAQSISVEYTGESILPELNLTLNGRKLTEGTDFEREAYYYYEGAADTPVKIMAAQVKKAGTYEVSVTGKGRYYGDLRVPFEIAPVSLRADEIAAQPIPDQEYQEGGAEPIPVLTFNGAELANGTDFALRYANNLSVGTGQVIAEGKGNFTGTLILSFNITEQQIDEESAAAYTQLLESLEIAVASAQSEEERAAAIEALRAAGDLTDTGGDNPSVQIIARSFTYTGDEIAPSGGALIVRKTIDGISYDLKQDVHYTIEVLNNTDVTEEAHLTIRGMTEEFRGQARTWGSADTVFKILPADLAGVVITAEDQTYTGSALEPEPAASYNGKLLTAEDYEQVQYESNVNAGNGSITLAGRGNFTGTGTGTFTIRPAVLTASYAGETIAVGEKPELTVNVTGFVGGESPASLGAEYKAPLLIAEVNEPGVYELTPSGGSAKNYTFKYVSGTLVITGKPVTPVVTLSPASYTWNGKAKKPAVTVKVDGKKLTADTDYTVSYAAGRRNVGSYTVTVNLQGIYAGTGKAVFKINPKGTTLGKLTGGSKSMTVRWKKQAKKMSSKRITGYQIQYSLKKNFKSSKKVFVKDYKKTSYKVKKLKKRKTYYVRIRTYTKVGKATFYSPWSKKKKVRVK